MIRVAIADDSAFTRGLLAGYLERAGDCEVAGMARDAASTLALVRRERPDVLTLDLEMPGPSGLDLLHQIVTETGTPVVVISGVTRRAAATTLRALELGAVDFVMKYTPGAPVCPDSLRREIIAKVGIAAAVRSRGSRERTARVGAAAPRRPVSPHPGHDPSPRAGGVIVIGASTGGPRAVRDVLAQLPANFATPCVIVQHLPAVFTRVFAADLGRHLRVPVVEAAAGDRLEPGRAWVAPGGKHLVFAGRGELDVQVPSDDDIHRPSIDLAMRSAAETYGSDALGIVLTGMGRDGAEGLHWIRARGGAAYVQDPESCIVASMPTSALERAGADYVAPPERLGQRLASRRDA